MTGNQMKRLLKYACESLLQISTRNVQIGAHNFRRNGKIVLGPPSWLQASQNHRKLQFDMASEGRGAQIEAERCPVWEVVSPKYLNY